MPDWSTVTPRLEYDKIFNPTKPESFNWQSYFIATGTNPCTDEILFGHVRYLEQTVAERLFEHGKHIFVKSENDNERVARIELCCKGRLMINYLTTDERDKREDCDGEIAINDVVANAKEVERSIKRVLAEEKDKRRKWDFLDVEQISKYRDVLDCRLNDLIKATGTNPCTDEILFGHVRYLEQTVAERLFEHGKHIFVKSENDNELLAEEKDKRRKWDFLDVEQISKYRDVLDCRLNDLIKEGQYFEIQDAAEPRCVFCCKVLANYGGIVVYEALDYVMTINITDPRCHSMGWVSQHQDDSVAYCPGKYSAEALKMFSKNAVPDIVFKRIELREHFFKIGSLVEVQDAEQRAAIYPGHVTEIINSRFVRIVSSSLGSVDTREVVAYRGSPGVFPQGFCNSIGYPLSIPRSSAMLKGRAPDAGWSWKNYAAHWGIPGIPTSEVNFEPLISRDTKITPMRHVEVFCYRQGVMYAALIHRAVRNLVLIELSCDTTPNPPLMFPIGSDCIFPCGFASAHDIPFVAEAPFLSLPPLKSEGVRFDILKNEYSSKPCNIFQERKVTDKTFVPEYWLKDDVWLPRIYVHPSCRLGPWFVRSQVAALARYYEAGPLVHVFKVLIADLYQCVAIEHRMEMQSMLNTDDEDVAVLHVKFKWRTSPDHVLMRVPSLQNCSAGMFSYAPSVVAPICYRLRIRRGDRIASGIRSQRCNLNNVEKRRRRTAKTGTAKRRRTQPLSPSKGTDQQTCRIANASDHDFSRSSIDEMPRLQPADTTDFIPNGRSHTEETRQAHACSSSDEMPTTTFNGLSNNDASPQRPLRLESDAMEWDERQLIQFLRATFPDLTDVTNVLQREHIDGAHLLTMSQQDCIDSLGLQFGTST
ncbi:mbt repeat protein [Ostertagia ostertagi]